MKSRCMYIASVLVSVIMTPEHYNLYLYHYTIVIIIVASILAIMMSKYIRYYYDNYVIAFGLASGANVRSE